jgi:hypothetical protein
LSTKLVEYLSPLRGFAIFISDCAHGSRRGLHYFAASGGSSSPVI